MKLGDKVWILDNNRRTYTDPEGNKLSSPWYRGHFVEMYVTSETEQSYTLGYKPDSTGGYKVKKSDPFIRGIIGIDPKIYYSEKEVDDACWIHDNKQRLIHYIQSSDDARLLQSIDYLINAREQLKQEKKVYADNTQILINEYYDLCDRLYINRNAQKTRYVGSSKELAKMIERDESRKRELEIKLNIEPNKE